MKVLVICIFECLFFIVSTVICFLAYREFKGILFDNGLNGGNIMQYLWGRDPGPVP